MWPYMFSLPNLNGIALLQMNKIISLTIRETEEEKATT